MGPNKVHVQAIDDAMNGLQASKRPRGVAFLWRVCAGSAANRCRPMQAVGSASELYRRPPYRIADSLMPATFDETN